MKKLLLFLFTILPVIALSQNSDFIINGKLANIHSPAKVYLLNTETGALDSTLVKNGIYRFNGKISRPTIANLFLDKENKEYKCIFCFF